MVAAAMDEVQNDELPSETCLQCLPLETLAQHRDRVGGGVAAALSVVVPGRPSCVRQFKTGGVYTCSLKIEDDEIKDASFLIKVVGFDSTRMLDQGGGPSPRTSPFQYRIFGNDTQAIELMHGIDYLSTDESPGAEQLRAGTNAHAGMISVYFGPRELQQIFVSSTRVILKTGVLLFCATKLIVLARRAKESMYAPGGIGFIAAQEDFDRAAKAIYETFEQADRDAKRQCIE